MKRIKAYFNNFFWLFSTYLLAPYFFFRIFLAHCSPTVHTQHTGRRKSKNPKILVIQTAKIGDLVCTTPVFREIKKKFPSSHLSAIVISKTKDILKNNPHIDEIILITDFTGLIGKMKLLRKLRKEKYDWAFNFLPGSFDNIIPFWSLIPNRVTTTHKEAGEIIKLFSVFNNYRLEWKRHAFLPGHHLNLLKFIGIEEFSEKKEIFVRPEEEKKALDFLRENHLSSQDLLIGIGVAAGDYKFKEWGLDKFAKLADLLVERLRAKIIFIGSDKDKERVESVQKMMQNSSVNSCGVFKLYELPALLKNLKLFVSGDTGPLYIADAVGVLLVDIPGPIDVYEQSPQHERCKIVKKDIYCAPCWSGTRPVSFCKEGHHKCLEDVSPEEVFEAAEDLIDKYL